MTENDPAAINSAVDRLTTASHKLAEAMYKASSAARRRALRRPPVTAAPARQGESRQVNDKDNVVDAEFVDVDDKK